LPSFQRKPDHELDRLDDDSLIAYIRAARHAGDRSAAGRALGVLVFGHWRNVERRVRLKVPAEHVEDVTEDIVLSAIQSAFDGTSVGEFVSWLRRITQRRIADFHRRAESVPRLVPLVADPDAAPRAPDPAVASEEGAIEAQDAVDRVLARLSEPHRRVVEAIVFEGLTAREAARAVPDMTEANAHQIVSRFRRALRRELEHGDTSGG
jgi:RNA polymerase sigma factor (sigma-70 family)